MMKKKDRKEIFDLFCQTFSEKEFEVVSGLNPCIIKYNGTRYNVYIKNLTPAQLTNNNPDIWRCQLPKKTIFDDFKASPDIFLLLGYDSSNDVYATWNPYWAKQRLNIGESVSMYSRYSIQKESAHNHSFIEFDLNHKGIVIVFPRVLLCEYLDKMNQYFEQETGYKAIGSSLRKARVVTSDMSKAEITYSYFSSKDRIPNYHNFINALAVSSTTKNKYKRALKYLFESGLIQKYRSLFEEYEDIDEYDKAIESFLQTDELSSADKRDTGGWHGYLKTSLQYYLKSILSLEIVIPQNESDIEDVDDSLPNICTPTLIEKIAPLMCEDEPKLMDAMGILYQEFGDTYKNKMQLNDWVNLLKSKNWALLSGKCTGTHILSEQSNECGKHTILKVTLSNGVVIFHPKSIDTYVDVIEHLFPDLIFETGLILRNTPLVSKQRINERQVELKDGYFLSVCSHTKDLARVLQCVAQELCEPISIEIVPKSFSQS